ncbi:MAG: CpsD/CapB family tyrosine-protein kinase [Bryobacteraceae bacterium]
MNLFSNLLRREERPAGLSGGAGAAQVQPPSNSEAVEPRENTQSPRIRILTCSIPPNSPIFPFDGRDRRAAEQYRLVRTKIAHHPGNIKLIAVSSPDAGDGKTVTAVNLAGALALKNESDTLLVDADWRRSRIAASLGIPATPGLADVLAGRCPVHEAIVRLTSPPNLYVLPSGRDLRNATELLDSRQWRALTADFRAHFNYTVIDTTPVGVVADYELVQALVDGVIIVVRPDHTNRARCYAALNAVASEKLLGVVTNCVSDSFLSPAYTRGYQYYSQPGEHVTRVNDESGEEGERP